LLLTPAGIMNMGEGLGEGTSAGHLAPPAGLLLNTGVAAVVCIGSAT